MSTHKEKKVQNTEFSLTTIQAFEQAKMTAHDYLFSAKDTLRKTCEENEPFSISDCIELAKVMAMDFQTSMYCAKMQEIRAMLSCISGDLDSIAQRMPEK